MRFKLFLYFILSLSLIVFAENDHIKVTGIVADKEFRLGNATVCFFNSSNDIVCTKSDINGNFNISLPKNKYRVTVKKNGYTSLVGDNFFVDYIFEKSKPLILNMTNNKITIIGKVIDQNNDIVQNAEVKVKIGEKLENILTDSNGNFSFKGETGLISIFANKLGFYGNGTSLLIENEKFVNDISITLQAKTFYISGAVVKGNSYIQNTQLELINASNNKVISTLNTSDDGLFEFRNILFYEKAYFRIPKFNFKSNTFSINQDLRQFNIFIE